MGWLIGFVIFYYAMVQANGIEVLSPTGFWGYIFWLVVSPFVFIIIYVLWTITKKG